MGSSTVSKLSFELSLSLRGSVVCPSVNCCIHVLGLHVAVAVGWGIVLSGKLILGLSVPLRLASTMVGEVGAEVDVGALVVVGTLKTLLLSLTYTSD